jgi:serine/threonine-protein kinase RsbW
VDARPVPEDFERRLTADLGGIAALAADFSAWAARAALTSREAAQVKLALEELVTNVIVHGFAASGAGWMRLRIARRAGHLTIELRDNAPAFDPFGVPAPPLDQDIAERRVGGLGVHLVRTLMDAYGYVRDADQNVVSLRKRLGRP